MPTQPAAPPVCNHAARFANIDKGVKGLRPQRRKFPNSVSDQEQLPLDGTWRRLSATAPGGWESLNQMRSCHIPKLYRMPDGANRVKVEGQVMDAVEHRGEPFVRGVQMPQIRARITRAHHA